MTNDDTEVTYDPRHIKFEAVKHFLSNPKASLGHIQSYYKQEDEKPKYEPLLNRIATIKSLQGIKSDKHSALSSCNFNVDYAPP